MIFYILEANLMTNIQYISYENGNPVGVIVPIDLWREIESEREKRQITSECSKSISIASSYL